MIIIPFLFVLCPVFAQGYFFGLYANSYLETAKYGSDKNVRVKKNISIIYNKDYCKFYVEGKGSFFFKTRNYERKMQGKYLQTSFLSQETSTTPDHYYDVTIFESKDGIMFEVALTSYAGDKVYPNGFTYLVEKADKYSENGKVNGNIQIENWKELEKQERINDSVIRVRREEEEKVLRQNKIEDSLFIVKRDSLRNIGQHYILMKGDNLNPIDIKFLMDTIAAKITVAKNDYFYNNFKILIDENGVITNAVPYDRQGHIIEKYLPLIDKAIAGIKVKAYEAPNGLNYPSYAILNITLMCDPNEKPKKKKLLNRLAGMMIH